MWGINNTQTMVDEGCLMLGLNYWCNMNAFNSFRRTVSNGIPLARLDHQWIWLNINQYIYMYIYMLYMLCIYICYVYNYIYLFNSIYSMLMSAMFFPPSWLPTNRTNTPSQESRSVVPNRCFSSFWMRAFSPTSYCLGRAIVPCRHLHGLPR